MTEQILIRQDAASIARLTLNNPGALNALSDTMLSALKDELTQLANDTSIRVVIIVGAGKVFCAGHDLKEMTRGRTADDGGHAYFNDLFTRCGEVMKQITRLPQPVIAEVHGIATAAGCQMVASCDMAVAAEGTHFGVNGVNIGLFCSTPMVALTRNITRKQAFEMLTTGDFIDAAQARELGLVNRVVPAENLRTATDDLALKVASKLGAAIKVGKAAFYEQATMGLDEAYAYTGQIMAENMMNQDTTEGINAFIEKRTPKWTQT